MCGAALDKRYFFWYNKNKSEKYRSGKRGPIGLIFIKKYDIIKVEAIWPIGSRTDLLTLYKKYDIIIMEENNNKPIGFTGYLRPYARPL